MMSLFAPRPPVFRPLTAADARAAAAIHAEGFARGWGAADIEALILDPAVIGDAAARSGGSALIGFALSRLAADEAEVLSICVRRKDQGRGVASGLLGHHLSHLASRGARAVFLEVEEGNNPAIALYRRFGFVDVGLRRGYYHRLDGRAADAIVMRRALD